MFDFDLEYDVAVVGAGVAGVAAAVQAARSGMKTVLLEKTILPGGLATTGLVYIYLPLCDGNGRQVSTGITEELMRLSLKYGPGDIPENWKNGSNAPEAERLRCVFSPASFILALDEMLQQAGVDIWYDTLVCDAETDNGKVSSVIVENESGRGRIRAKCVVDASGSCIAARRAGIPCHDEFNFLSVWAIQHNREVKDGPLGPCLQMHADGVAWNPETAPEGTLFRGISGKTVSEFVLKSRKMLLDYYKKAYADESGKYSRGNLFAVKVPAMPQFRKIFSLDAAYVLTTGENNKHFDDSVGLCGDWRKAGPVWEIPYRSLYPENGFGGYLSAGRCTGASADAWEVTRVIPVAALTGQVCGLAAAMCVKQQVEPPALNVDELQKQLRELGFPLHLEDVGLNAK